jgi:hypothetical protein
MEGRRHETEHALGPRRHGGHYLADREHLVRTRRGVHPGVGLGAKRVSAAVRARQVALWSALPAKRLEWAWP